MVSYEHKVKNIYLGEPRNFPYYTYDSNTILYCPLNEDFSDKTGNFTLTGSGPITGKYDDIDVTYFNRNYITTTVNYSRTDNITVSLVAKVITDGSFVGQRGTSGPWNWFVGTTSSYNGLSSGRGTEYTFPTNQRATITVLIPTGSNYPTVYINGTQTGISRSFSGTNTGNMPIYIGHDGNGSAGIQGYISNVIIDNGHRDTTKITNRHNEIKDYYGIS